MQPQLSTNSVSCQEVWRPIPDWPYEASNLGRIRRVGGGYGATPGRILNWHPAGKYPFVMLSNGGKHWPRQVHLLVAAAFLGPTPPGMEVNHKDRNKWNPRLGNLEFVTPSENIKDSVSNGHRGTNRWNAVLNEDDVRRIRHLAGQGWGSKKIAGWLGFNPTTVYHVVKGHNWKHIQ